jgi:methyl-coenzyme M reductase subunit D
MRKAIHVGDQELDLQVHVGTIVLELENREIIPALQAAIEPVFTNFTFRIQEGRYMKTEPSLVDYCKYGPDADRDIIGMADPSSKSKPVILQGHK